MKNNSEKYLLIDRWEEKAYNEDSNKGESVTF